MRLTELNIAPYLQYNKFIEIENIGLFWVHISGKKTFPQTFLPIFSFIFPFNILLTLKFQSNTTFTK